MRRPWRRFVAILILVMLALLRVESTNARMQGLLREPSRILRLELLTSGARVHLAGWAVPIHPAAVEALAQAPSRVREGAEELFEGVARALRAWGSDPR